MTDKASNFSEWVKQYPTVSTADLAETAITDVPDLLVSVVMQEIDHVRRLEVQHLETKARFDFLRIVPGNSVLPTVASFPPAFLQLLRETFALGDGTHVKWGLATVSQHEQRIRLLQLQISGLTATVRKHEMAIECIQAAGVSCLDETVTLDRIPAV